ncbi:MAG: hypothetical protein QTN59_04800 [Candidatus Electrothrix communis]|nr:MAG: hypothetical protein QTN59_04800 [Candidatus Electrothrix communis]
MNNYERFLSFCKSMIHCKVLFTLLALLVLTGCAAQTDFRDEDIRPLPFSIPFVIKGEGEGDHRRHIAGIRQALNKFPDQPVRVLVIHGMITDKARYSEGMQKRIGERLGLELADNEPEAINITRGYDFTPYLGPQPLDLGPLPLRNKPKLSELRKYVWVDDQQPDLPRLIYYEVLWAPFRNQVKNEFLACFESRSVESRKNNCTPVKEKRNTDSRTWVNGLLKDDIMINGFADPIILLGPLGDIIKDDIMLANCIVARDILDNTDETFKRFKEERCNLSSYVIDEETYQDTASILLKTPFVTITESLGSFLYLDTEQRFSQAATLENELRKENGRELSSEELQDSQLFNLYDQRTVYMMANQISLLLLARYTAEDCYSDTDEEGECPNRLLRNRTEPLEPITARSTYVAFNDANDLLGFDITPNLQYTGTYGKVVNISVRNPGLSIPFLFKSPSAAHKNHADNPAVIKAVVEGIEIPIKQLEK